MDGPTQKTTSRAANAYALANCFVRSNLGVMVRYTSAGAVKKH